MAERTDELKREIEGTRDRMSTTLDAIGDRMSPGRVVERRWNRVRLSTSRMRDSVMGTPRQVGGRLHSSTSTMATHAGGTASSLGDRASGLVASAEESASGAMSSIAEGIQGAPDTIKEGTSGNPLVAGGIAFGLGMLLGSLAPPSREETRMAERLMEPVKEQLTDVGHQIADSTREQAQAGIEQAKASATDAAEAVKERASGAAEEVAATADQAKQEVAGQARSSAQEVKERGPA